MSRVGWLELAAPSLVPRPRPLTASLLCSLPRRVQETTPSSMQLEVERLLLLEMSSQDLPRSVLEVQLEAWLFSSPGTTRAVPISGLRAEHSSPRCQVSGCKLP